MKRLPFLPFTAVLLPSALCAQSADADIERTLLAAPRVNACRGDDPRAPS